jgi:dTDP-4-amino-4,6-dideoxygalactose transaminase
MSDWAVPLSDVVMSDSDVEAVVSVLRSGWLSMGPETQRFEEALAAYTGARHAIAVANGTAALHLACLGAGLAPGDEVIVPSLTFVATVNAVAYTGATPVFADIAGLSEPWLSASTVEAALTARTRAVMTMTYGGHHGEIEALRRLTEERGLLLLEDAAHGIGSRLGERHLGTFGNAGAFSFFSNKNLSLGEGGAVVTDDEELATRVRLLRSHGMTTLTWDRHRGHATEYDVVARGFNYRLDEPRAALGRSRLARLDQANAGRQAVATTYRERLSDVPGIRLLAPPSPRATVANHLFPIVLEPAAGLDRDRFRAELADRRVQTSVHYPPAHRFAIYADEGTQLPVTDEYAERTVTLPMFGHMDESQVSLVIDSVTASAGALQG